MKRKNIIKEQESKQPTKNVQVGPQNEINGFASAGFNTPTMSKKPIIPLCTSNTFGLPGVKVGGKIYYTGKKISKAGETTPFGIVVYDGNILIKDDPNDIGVGCNGYKFYSKDGVIQHWPGVQAVPEFNEEVLKALQSFNIKSDKLTDIYAYITEITKYLKSLVEKGAKSALFNEWNRILVWYYPNDDTMRLTPKDGTSLNPPENADEKSKYVDKNIKDVFPKLSYLGSGFMISVPKNIAMDVNVNTSKRTPESCRTTLLRYLTGAFAKLSDPEFAIPNNLTQQKSELQMCTNKIGWDKFKSIKPAEILSSGTELGDNKIQLSKKLSPFGVLNKELSISEIKKILYGGKLMTNLRKKYSIDAPYRLENEELDIKSLNENVRIKSIIKNKLNVLTENKQKLITENQIIKSRFNVIKEFKVSKEKKSLEMINETIEMISLGFDEKLVTENLMDMMKGMFGLGTEGIIQYVKEKLLESLIKKLTPLDPDGWLGGILVKGLADIPLGDFVNGNIWKCNFLVPHIAKAIVEEAISKAGDKKGLTGGFYDVLRNSIVQGLESTDFAKSIEGGLSAMICPLLNNVGDKMGDLFDTMKQKALS